MSSYWTDDNCHYVQVIKSDYIDECRGCKQQKQLHILQYVFEGDYRRYTDDMLRLCADCFEKIGKDSKKLFGKQDEW